MKKLTSLLMALILGLTLISVAQALPVTVNRVELNDIELSPSSSTRLDIERSQQIEVEVELTATEKIKHLELQTFLTGFEYNDVKKIGDATETFDMEPGIKYAKKLTVKLSDLLELDNYKLRLTISDRDGDILVQNYNLKIDAPRHSLTIKDVTIFPSTNLKAGQALSAMVRIRNTGQKDEKNVKVTVSIPELGYSIPDYINVNNNDDEEETEEINFRLPKCMKAGQYTVLVKADYAENHRSTEERRTIFVEENEQCSASDDVKTSTKMQTNTLTQTATRGSSFVVPLTVTNNAKSSKVYSLVAVSPNGLSTQVAPTNTIVLEAGKTQTFNVQVDVTQDATIGTNALTLTLMSGNEAISQTTIAVTVEGSDSALAGLTARTALQGSLILLALLLVAVAVIVAVKSANKTKKSKESYY